MNRLQYLKQKTNAFRISVEYVGETGDDTCYYDTEKELLQADRSFHFQKKYVYLEAYDRQGCVMNSIEAVTLDQAIDGAFELWT